MILSGPCYIELSQKKHVDLELEGFILENIHEYSYYRLSINNFKDILNIF